ncbi:TonB-dependent receptor [Aquimarina sp. MMG016]|uniref:TonB-dependent receptor n=1 Tax=Aquimarina sp. MMG016 TaxID=2822690 RepID=UPI001B3A5269|nr:TonB-dependent receptor [Aquimarina sp. MMG016]MBQ4820752.1 TonB-dependent receptor [Aquimarina sp. MMG016]
MKFYASILFGLFFLTTQAQEKYTLSGYGKDITSGESLWGINIIVGPNQGTITNDYGFYSITLEKGTYTVEFSFIGFKTIIKEIVIDGDMKLNFEMEEDAAALDEVVVTSSKASRNIKSTEMSVATIKATTMKKLPTGLGEVDLVKSIQLLPGVSSVSEGSSGFNVRGGSADQNLVLLDEATIYNASHLLGFFSVFNADAVKDVKLHKGAIPATFGGRLSSVLDIKQREGNTKEFNGELGLGLISSRALVQGPINKDDNGEGKGSYLLAGRRSYIDLFAPLIDDFKDTKLFFYDVNLKVNYNLNDKNRLFLSGYFGRDRFAIDNVFGNTYGNGSATLRWTSELSDKLFFQASAIYSDYEYEVDVLTSGSEFRWKSNIVNYNFKPRFSWFISSGNTLRTGADFTYYNFNPGEISALNNSSTTPQDFQDKYALEIAPYIDFEHKLSDKLSLQYGVRWSNFQRIGKETVSQYANGSPLTYNPTLDLFEENEVVGTTSFDSGDAIKTFNNIEPRASARYLWNKTTSIKASYNRNYQYLHLISNSTSATPLDIWTPSGSYLKPQYSDQFAIGYFKTLKNNTYDFSIEAYYKDLRDVTDFVDGADLLFQENIETQVVQGKGRAYGIEFQLNKNSGKLTGWLSYTLAKSERQVLGINNNEYYPSNNDQTHELSIVGLYKLNDRWDFGANFVYGSGKPVTYPTGKFEQNGLVVADYEGRNGNRLPAFHRLDLSATLNPKEGGNGTWIFSIGNVYNRQNAATIFFRERVDEINNVNIPTGQTEASKFSFLGIVPSITYQFKF